MDSIIFSLNKASNRHANFPYEEKIKKKKSVFIITSMFKKQYFLDKIMKHFH